MHGTYLVAASSQVACTRGGMIQCAHDPRYAQSMGHFDICHGLDWTSLVINKVPGYGSIKRDIYFGICLLPHRINHSTPAYEVFVWFVVIPHMLDASLHLDMRVHWQG